MGRIAYYMNITKAEAFFSYNEHTDWKERVRRTNIMIIYNYYI